MYEFKVNITPNYRRDVLSRTELNSLDRLMANSTKRITNENYKKFVGLVSKKGASFCPATFKKVH
ncbi:MAG: hypothetical protein Q4C58_06020 [Eubacteriales bacterium]|nr:hypothetical protein [Eubacteriales bacterium]